MRWLQNIFFARFAENAADDAVGDALLSLQKDRRPDLIKCREMCTYVHQRFKKIFPNANANANANPNAGAKEVWEEVGMKWEKADTLKKFMIALAEHEEADKVYLKEPLESGLKLLANVLLLHKEVHRLEEDPPQTWAKVGIVPNLDELDFKKERVKAAVYMHAAILELDGDHVVLWWNPTSDYGKRFKKQVAQILLENSKYTR